MTSKLLLEAGVRRDDLQVEHVLPPRRQQQHRQHLRVGRAFHTVRRGLPGPPERPGPLHAAGVTVVRHGIHNFKIGFQTDEANTNTYWQANQNVNYYFYNGVPILIPQWATLIGKIEGQGRHGHLRPGSVEGHEQNDAEPGCGGTTSTATCRRRRPGFRVKPTAISEPTSQSLARPAAVLSRCTTCRAGRTSTRGWASRTTCSATARPR